MMEWADIAKLYRYWRDAPPVHELVALAIGWKPPADDVTDANRIDIGMTYKELEAAMARGTPLFQAGA